MVLCYKFITFLIFVGTTKGNDYVEQIVGTIGWNDKGERLCGTNWVERIGQNELGRTNWVERIGQNNYGEQLGGTTSENNKIYLIYDINYYYQLIN